MTDRLAISIGVDGDKGVGSKDLSIILAEFGALGDSETCDVVECGPEGGLGPLQKCRRAANRAFFICAGAEAILALICLGVCAAACSASLIVFPPAAQFVCHACWRGVLARFGNPGLILICAGAWIGAYLNCALQ